MSVRLTLSRFLLRLGAFVQSLPVVVLKPHQLVEFSRQTYAKPGVVDSWSVADIIDSGLSPDEKDLLTDVPQTTSNLLLLGVGGGREAIPLAQMGFQVTGVDFVAEMVAQAKGNAAACGVTIQGLVQDITNLDVPAGSYEVVWISRAMYSCVPTRKRRVEMVRRIARALKPGGFFLCQFHQNPRMQVTPRGLFFRRLIAACTFGNREYQSGDMLWFNIEFLHAFASEDEVGSEIEEGGLDIVRFQTNRNPTYRGVVCQKSGQSAKL